MSGCSGASGSGAMTVISREDGSGTRSAFVELFEVQDTDKNDITVSSAEVTNNTGVMMTSVAGDKNAIGYISLGSLNDTVKALKIDGVSANAENVSNKSYTISRPFYIAVKGRASEYAQDFINFILSKEGQDVVDANGYVRIQDTGAFSSSNPSGKIVVAGSSSITPVMEKLKEAYAAINPGLTVDIQQSDSSAGMNSAVDGICDIGMSSRELKDSELEKGLVPALIAMDGLAVIINKDNPVEGLTKAQVKSIYTGEVKNWTDLQ
ncbi:MAG: substrate-binding domain-containing protein [Clostridiales bacterium]|nr:substrate-binding domain-containing protein [Clostridiales bacterium]